MVTVAISVHPSEGFFQIGENYVSCIQKAGGLPFLIAQANDAQAALYAQKMDALLLSGGGDIDPSLYGQKCEKETSGISPLRDAAEFALLKAFIEKGKPVLGICRGVQLLAACLGGTLTQDIPSFYHTSHTGGLLHDVSIKEELSSLYQKDTLRVNSYHHQCVKTLPDGFHVTALSPEGFPEAIQKDNLLGVQWHPERMPWEESEPIFSWLIQQAQKEGSPL